MWFDNIVWADVPVSLFLLVGIVMMLTLVWRNGWDGARNILNRYRWWWVSSLALVVLGTVAVALSTGVYPSMLL